jgi:hypothetical protein
MDTMQIMKVYLLLAVMIVWHLPAVGVLTEDELDLFDKRLQIAAIRTDDWKNEDREKYEVLEVNTVQSQDDPRNYDMKRFRIRMAVELTDQEKNTYLVQVTGNAPDSYNLDYKGEDYWKLYMAHGDLGRLKITGYAVQYGIMDGEEFVPLAENEDDADEMLERVRQQTTVLFPGRLYLRHYYIYDDSNEGDTESVPVNIRLVKE